MTYRPGQCCLWCGVRRARWAYSDPASISPCSYRNMHSNVDIESECSSSLQRSMSPQWRWSIDAWQSLACWMRDLFRTVWHDENTLVPSCCEHIAAAQDGSFPVHLEFSDSGESQREPSASLFRSSADDKLESWLDLYRSSDIFSWWRCLCQSLHASVAEQDCAHDHFQSVDSVSASHETSLFGCIFSAKREQKAFCYRHTYKPYTMSGTYHRSRRIPSAVSQSGILSSVS